MSLDVWRPPLFSFGPEPPVERKIQAAERRLERIRTASSKILATSSADAAWMMTPEALIEVARQLDEQSFCVLDDFLGRSAWVDAMRDNISATLARTSGGVGRVAGADGDASGGATVTAFRSDISLWARADNTARVPALDKLTSRLENLVSGLRRIHISTEFVDGPGASAAASTAASRTTDELAFVRWRAADAMLASYPAGGARYIRHLDNVCLRGEGSRCNGRKLTAVYYLNDPAEHDAAAKVGDNARASYSPGALRIFHPGPPTSSPRVDVRPRPDRLAIFWSDERVPHAVLPTSPGRERLAVTFWFFCEAELNRTAEGARADSQARAALHPFDEPLRR